MSAPTIRDRLYEAPGPSTRRRIAVFTVLALIALGFLLFLVVRQFARQGQMEARYWDFFLKWSTWRYLGQGLLSTLKAALTAAMIAIGLGFILMRGKLRRNPVLRWTATAVIEFTRGVPTLLLIYFFFLVLPRLGVNLGAFWRITLPCAISASGIIAEAFRAGVNAVPKGQTEAALSLGLSNSRTFYQVVFPQALRFVIPSLISELVIVLKDTTFAYVVSYADLMQHAKVLITSHDALVSVYLVVAVIYILINYALNRLSDRVARGNRLSTVQRQGETA
ncbi:MAG: amino acid ABC transporter permease [Clostridia bacterium]|nr:amino acid ABC transporter permease [Clostridia bacterium]